MASRILPRLYVITNRHQTRERPLQAVLQYTLQAGTQFIQLREKDLTTPELLTLAKDIRQETQKHNALLLINDRVDIAMAIEADGVHLRSSSLPIKETRKILGPHAIIGKSTHTLDEALEAESDGADFVVFGPIYDTPSKRRYGPPLGLPLLQETSHRCSLPIYAIGGMTPERVQEIRNAGAYGVAVISAILESESVASATQHFLEYI